MLAFVVIGFAIVICATAVIIFFSYNAKKTSTNKFRITDIYDIKLINIHDIDRLDEHSEFVVYFYRLLKDIGFANVIKTNDTEHGADIVFTDDAGHPIVVLLKNDASQYMVNVDAVQEVVSSLEFYKANKGMLVSATSFTEAAKEIASKEDVLLLDRNDLMTIIEDHKNNVGQVAKNKILGISGSQ